MSPSCERSRGSASSVAAAAARRISSAASPLAWAAIWYNLSLDCSGPCWLQVLISTCLRLFRSLSAGVAHNYVVVSAQVSRKVNLVYGGGSVGLMGQVAQTVHAGGGHVIG